MIATAEDAMRTLESLREPERVEVLPRFFKTGPGQYAEGDVFLGIRVPVLRKLSRELRETPLTELVTLLRSPYNEARLLALFGMVEQYRRGNGEDRGKLYRAYLANIRWVNNWNLVDSSAEHIVGAYLWDGDRSILRRLASSDSISERRIAILSTFHFIRKHAYRDTLELAEMLLRDRVDLIHKAVGWMLREVGNRDRKVLDGFLQRTHNIMPRTTLRYAIEKHSAEERKNYLRPVAGT